MEGIGAGEGRTYLKSLRTFCSNSSAAPQLSEVIFEGFQLEGGVRGLWGGIARCLNIADERSTCRVAERGRSAVVRAVEGVPVHELDQIAGDVAARDVALQREVRVGEAVEGGYERLRGESWTRGWARGLRVGLVEVQMSITLVA